MAKRWYPAFAVSLAAVVFAMLISGVVSNFGRHMQTLSTTTSSVSLKMKKPFVNLVPSNTNNEIPKLIHHIYRSESSLKPIQKQWMKTWEQAGWQHVFWSDDDCERLVKETVPWFHKTYKSYPYNVQRSDMARIVILRSFGGVYVDTDYELLQPSSLHNITQSNCSVSLMEGPTLNVDGLFQNTFMVSDTSTSAVTFWETCLKKSAALLRDSNWKTIFGFHGTGTVMMVTGPGLLTQSYSVMRKLDHRLSDCLGTFHNFDGNLLLQLFESNLPKNSSSDICVLPASVYSGQGSLDVHSLSAVHHNTRSWIRIVHYQSHYIPRVLVGVLTLFIPVVLARFGITSYWRCGLPLTVLICIFTDFPSAYLPSEQLFVVLFLTYWCLLLK